MIFVGICGPSNSGKSSLCEALTKKYHAEWVEVDHYLKDKKEIPFTGKYRNWELPQNHKFDMLFKDLKKLSQGKIINHPIYSFKKGKIKGYRQIKPKKIIFVEGFYLFSDKNIRELLNIKIYLNIPIKEFLKRRICTEEKYEWTQKEYLNKIVIPMYKKYGIAQKKYADFIIDATIPLQEIKNRVNDILKSNITKS